MKCYYSSRDCKDCTKKRHCPIFKAWLFQKDLVAKLEDEILMKDQPPERDEP